MGYESVKEKLSGVTKISVARTVNLKMKTVIRLESTPLSTALQKFKKLFPHYRLTESTVRAMREKYHRIVKSPS